MSPHAEFATIDTEFPCISKDVLSDADGFLRVNGPSSYSQNRSHLQHTEKDEIHDLLCVGFGPASLAIATALHDSLDGSDPSLDIPSLHQRAPKVAFLERQKAFAWHAGMLLPGAKMQITFMKDMATLRNPRSEFTFINYLFRENRLVEFTNLNTFLPQRVEYEAYMRWCASWFEDVVEYSQEVVQIVPEQAKGGRGQIKIFAVTSKNLQTGELETRRARHVVVAAGGQPNIPKPFPSNHARVMHSSQFCHISSKLLTDFQAPYKIAVVGNGQSAAEIFDYLHAHYPNSQTRLLIKGGALRPSDDSPFVNEIFNPARVNSTFSRDPTLRSAALLEDKGTNYGVVRLGLLEHIYETLYTQRIQYGNSAHAEENLWPHRIMPYRTTTSVTSSPVVQGGVRLHVRDQSPLYLGEEAGATEREDVLDVDAVFVATGYRRDLHEKLLGGARELMLGGASEGGKWQVGRDYRVLFEGDSVSRDAGVWLQGCCESTHGLSDTLLSILASRAGQLVKSIFDGDEQGPKAQQDGAATWQGLAN